jgi:hypothetical protein
MFPSNARIDFLLHAAVSAVEFYVDGVVEGMTV